MRDFQRTRLNRVTGLREGSKPLGFELEGTDSDSGWYRLLPDGVEAEYDGDNRLKLQGLRGDIDGLNLRGWGVWVSNNDDYMVEANVNVHQEDIVEGYSWLNLPDETGLRYVLSPPFLFPPVIKFQSGGAGRLEIGYSTGLISPGVSGYSRQVVLGDTTDIQVKLLYALDPGQALNVPVSSIRNLFYKFTEASVDNIIYWGEQ